jgi:hypothetical protein
MSVSFASPATLAVAVAFCRLLDSSDTSLFVVFTMIAMADLLGK